MTLPSNGIIADVIREIMPPYHLSADLLAATFAALPPPPPDAPPTWRHARITRLIEEISALLPADAAQARLATQILIVRGQADTLATRAYAPDVTVEQMCRLSRSSTELVRTAALLVRTLERCQQKPAPFFGTVVEDEVDVAAVDAVWRNDPIYREAAPNVTPASAAEAPQPGRLEPEPTADPPNAAPLAADAEPSPPATDAEPPPAKTPMSVSAATAAQAQRDRSPDAAAGPAGDACPTTRPAPGSVVTRLDQVPGWTLEVVRRRTGVGAAAGPDA